MSGLPFRSNSSRTALAACSNAAVSHRTVPRPGLADGADTSWRGFGQVEADGLPVGRTFRAGQPNIGLADCRERAHVTIRNGSGDPGQRGHRGRGCLADRPGRSPSVTAWLV